jgi:erythrocyte band 7 integral membrane protein
VNALGTIVGTMGAIPCCIICPNPFKEVNQGNVGLVTKFGKFYKAVDPGLVNINPLSERLIQIDVKIQTTEVPEQICMTKDNVTLRLTSVIYYHIVSPHKAAFGINNVKQALMERTQTTLRHVVGARVLQDVIERREEIAQSIGEIIEDVAAGWGVQVESMLIKDIVFSQELQESLSMAAQSKRIGESKIIAAKAEVTFYIIFTLSHSTNILLGRIRQAYATSCRYSELGSCHADPIPRGYASHGQVCQQQGHLLACCQSDHG